MRAIAIVLHVALLAPLPPNLPKGPPDLTGPCIHGNIEQVGNRIRVSGSGPWLATGIRRDDGSIRLMWLNLDDGKTAIGVYFRRPGGRIDGCWGWAADVTDDECGGLFGPTIDEVIRWGEGE